VPIRGAYHYFRSEHSPINKSITFPWKKQADFFLKCVKGKDFDFYALDFEVNKFPEFGNEVDNIDDVDFSNNAKEWMDYVHEASEGKQLMIYTNINLYTKYRGWMDKWPLWIAHPRKDLRRDAKPGLPQDAKKWRIWQYAWADKGEEYGVRSDKIDLNVYNGTKEDLRSWLKPDEEEKPVKPIEAIDDGGYTWEQLINAVREVGDTHDEPWERWIRKAKATAYVRKPELLDKPYSGPDIESWPLSPSEDSEKRRAEILKRLKEV
jgi:hypothetical protein